MYPLLPRSYQSELFLDRDEALVHLPGLGEHIPPLLLDACGHLHLLLWHCYVVHSQGAVALLDISAAGRGGWTREVGGNGLHNKIWQRVHKYYMLVWNVKPHQQL